MIIDKCYAVKRNLATGRVNGREAWQMEGRREQPRRHTRQRELVFEAVRALVGTHPSAAQVFDYVHERDARVSLATVYRNLDLLAAEGQILAIDTPHGCRYDARTDDHRHVLCVVCGKMEDVTLPYDKSLDAAIEKASGYAAVSHHTVYEGVCPACAATGHTAEG